MGSNNQHELLKIDKFLKKSNFLKLTNDIAFKAYFNLKLLFAYFLPLLKDSEIIKVDILYADLFSNSPTFLKSEDSSKRFFLDLKLHLRKITQSFVQKTKIVNLEMQTALRPYFTNRMLVYSHRFCSQQIKKCNNCNNLILVYSLVFITKN